MGHSLATNAFHAPVRRGGYSAYPARRMTRAPDITVVLPTYNRRPLLEHAITTCISGNEGVSVEVVVVDDGSTDDTRAFLASHPDPRVRPFYHGHLGPQQARNRGLAESAGRYVKFLDDDDWLAPELLAEEVRALDHTRADISVAHVTLHDGVRPLFDVGRCPDDDLLVNLISGALPTYPLRFTVRQSLAKAFEWDGALICGDDINYFWRVAAASQGWVRVSGHVFVRDHTGPRLTRDAYSQSVDWLAETVRLVGAFEQDGVLDTEDRRAAACVGLWSRIRPSSTRSNPLLHEAWTLIEGISGGQFRAPRPMRWMRWMDDRLGPIGTDLALGSVRAKRLWVQQLLQPIMTGRPIRR